MAVSQISLPTNSIGRLIGKGGATIKELETLTNCRVQIPRRQSVQGQDSNTEEVTSVSVRCVKNTGRPEILKTHEHRCLRVAHLLCIEGLSLAQACAQADDEHKAQELLDEEHQEEQQMRMAVQRILMSWPEFEREDVKAAMHEVCNDEDAAVDLILGGYRNPCTAEPMPKSMSGSKRLNQDPQPGPKRIEGRDTKPEPIEEFPVLISGEKKNSRHPSNCTLGRTSLTAWSRPVNKARPVEDFPCLPSTRPCSSMQRGAQKPCARTAARNLCRTHLRR